MVWSRFRELKSGIVQHYQDFSRFPRCAPPRASKSPLGRTAPDSLGARLLGRVNRPWVAPLPIPDSQFPIPDSRFPILNSRFPIPDSLRTYP
ncbi:MAG: hypothetical protein F6K26_27200 [Moorea sp. SIO2I5]|nr:hypothetical protein [Moorena sp. SIO2I5]